MPKKYEAIGYIVSDNKHFNTFIFTYFKQWFAIGHYSCRPSLKNFMQQEIFFAIAYKYLNTYIHFYAFSSYLNISPIGTFKKVSCIIILSVHYFIR